MNIASLLVFYLGCYGLTTIIVQSIIFKPVRLFVEDKGFKSLSKLLDCMMCTSFWVGLLSVIILRVSPTFSILADKNSCDMNVYRLLFTVLFDAFSVVAFVWMTYMVQCLIEDNLKREL
jgi:hypothetical protein